MYKYKYYFYYYNGRDIDGILTVDTELNLVEVEQKIAASGNFTVVSRHGLFKVFTSDLMAYGIEKVVEE